MTTIPSTAALSAAIALTLGAVLAGCASDPSVANSAANTTDLAPGEQIIDTRSGQPISRAALLQALRQADVVLLGEQHDNALHHQRRGELLVDFKPVAVVAEHLTAGQLARFGSAGTTTGTVAASGAVPTGTAVSAAPSDLLPALIAGGFDAKGLALALHEPLFAGVARIGLPLVGGNLPRDEARRVAREGAAAVPPGLAPLLTAAPLSAPAQGALDTALVQGHCGQLSGSRLEGMRWAQRARDAAMAQALLAARDAGAPGPVVLLAGNGHVRDDHGVPTLLAARQPAPRVVSVAFVDGSAAAAGAPYRYVWRTPAPTGRSDPCAGFMLPPARPATGGPAASAPR